MIQVLEHSKGIKEIIVRESSGFSVSFLNIGATIRSWITPQGIDIVAKYQEIENYLTNPMFLGCTVGPTCGRIRNGRIDNELFPIQYPENTQFKHNLHSGSKSYAFRLFDYQILSSEENESVIEFRLSDEDEWTKSSALVKVTYKISTNKVHVFFHVSSPVVRPMNMTNHSYFNLNGDFSNPMKHHYLMCNSSNVMLVDETYIPKRLVTTNSVLPKLMTNMKLETVIRHMQTIQPICKGIDHYLLFSQREHASIKLSSTLNHTSLTMKSSYPGCTVYTSNFPTHHLLSTGATLAFHGAVCMEPSFMPNAYNDSRFEMGLSKPSFPYTHDIEYIWEDHE